MDLVKKLIIISLIVIAACKPAADSSGLTTVKVQEVEQVANYTYMLVKAKGPAYWIAVPSMEVNVGGTYQYQGGMLMEDFHSKELDRTFDKVLFLETLFSTSGPAPEAQAGHPAMPNEAHPMVQEATPGSTVKAQKAEVSVDAAKGTTSIADLFANPADFAGRTIRVRGEVTKFNEAIMNRNWVHLQDGSEFEGKFDLTATSTEPFQMGSIVTLEGVLAINKDFGYGYKYEILLEEARAVD